jgi:hypothetical protein
MRSLGTKQVKNRIIQNKNEMNQNNREKLNNENRLTKLFEDFLDFKDYILVTHVPLVSFDAPRDTTIITT